LRLQETRWFLRRNTAETALPSTEFFQRRIQVAGLKIRPHAIGEPKFGIGTLPQQEVGKALLSSGSDQKVNILRAAAALGKELTQELSRR
jgi:hypothetical protein